MTRDLGPVTRITAGAVGEPGHRTFFLQASSGDEVVSLVIEKGQVAALAHELDGLLVRLASVQTAPEGDPPPDGDLDLLEPLSPEFRVAAMSLGYDADRDLVVLECHDTAPGQEPDEEPDEPIEAASIRFWATRAQVRGLATHGAQAVAQGRPLCELCGGPVDPDGHVCPALNGHRERRDPGA